MKIGFYMLFCSSSLSFRCSVLRVSFFSISLVFIVGVNGDEGTPVPIPNTVVKLIYGDNTWLDTAWKDNSMPTWLKDNWQPERCQLSYHIPQ